MVVQHENQGGILRWTKTETVVARNCEPPSRRSGHSLSIVGSCGYLFGGCEYSEPPGPTNDLFVLKINSNAPCEWEKIHFPVNSCPLPRWKHSATIVDNKIYVFGGFHSSSVRFNDMWMFNPITMSWSQPQLLSTNHRSSTAAMAGGGTGAGGPGGIGGRAVQVTLPAPRGAHSAVLIRKCIYVFGGYGGTGYGRKDFDDLHMFRLEDMSWTKVATKGKGPEKRAGHQACAVDDLMLVCGGWNSVAQFNDLHLFDTMTSSWSSVDGYHMANPLPRWNHVCCAVMAIPHSKVFVFGGVIGEANNYNGQGTFMNDISVLDSGDMSWSVPEIRGTPPCGRADTTLAYDDKGSRLLVFGGWANVWLSDLYTLDVSCVVGPPYGITGVFPEFGPITGGTSLVLEGIDFMNRPVTIRFSCRKGAIEVPGEYVNDHTLNVVTPDFSAFAAGDVQIRVALQGDSFTTTFQVFSFFAITDPTSCFAFGPGVLCGGACGEPTSFLVQARDATHQNRTRGGDEFVVELSTEESGNLFVPIDVHDLGNGTYRVTYTAPHPGEYRVNVEYAGTFGGIPGAIYGSPFRVTFEDTVTHEMNLMTGKLVLDQVLNDLQELQKLAKDCNVGLDQPLSDPSWSSDMTTNALITLKEHVYNVEKRGQDVSLLIDKLRNEIAFLKDAGITMNREQDVITAVEHLWHEVTKKVPSASARIAPLVSSQSLKTRNEAAIYLEQLQQKDTEVKQKSFWNFAIGCDEALERLQQELTVIKDEEQVFSRKKHVAEIFECEELMEPCEKVLYNVIRTLDHAQLLWQSISQVTRKIEFAKEIPWNNIDGVALEEEAKQFMNQVKAIHKDIRDCDAYKQFERIVKEFLALCPLLQALRHPSVRKRHWLELQELAQNPDFDCPEDEPELKLADILVLNLQNHMRDVEEITDRAQKEAKQETCLRELDARWNSIVFDKTNYKDTEVPLLHLNEESVEILESDQLLVQTMVNGKDNFFKNLSEQWYNNLAVVAEITSSLNEIQRSWSYLEPLFISSEEVRRELPEDATRFTHIDASVRKTLQTMWQKPNALTACQQPDLTRHLEELATGLEKCQKSLTDYLDSKRRLFPRFYFISEADLLDVLSNGAEPNKIMKHVDKVFLATQTLLLDQSTAAHSACATHFLSNVGRELVRFDKPVQIEGKVEIYLQTVLHAMKTTLKAAVVRSIERFPEQNRSEWLLQKLPPDHSLDHAKDKETLKEESHCADPAQIALLVAGIETTKGVEHAFTLMDKGNKKAMHEFSDKVVIQLTDLIHLTHTQLSKEDRQRIMCMITMDAHSRDIVQKLIYEQITSATSFLWQSQLKQRRTPHNDRTFLQILDAEFDYGFEYLGNGPRLVITPLTDRIYVTATQALNIQMGCAPAGPAGTGKTETTKDLANMVGKACYVFNCSPEMDFKNLGNIFKGLSSSGAWGCFDEFNRLAPEVLSVCSVQFKAVCDSIRGSSEFVVIEGDKVSLDPSCGTFITMNPGYLGRSELPEGLKALFRPITVMAPDLVLICENMLMAEGFGEAKVLASKFFSLYSLLKELLSKQDHYDWGLRAVKSVLVVAGVFKRAEPKMSEHQILMRALRDFNYPKIVEQDLVVFNGLLHDLFPDINPPRKVDEALEKYVQLACEELHLWPHESFRLKVVQLEEVLAIRHCVFMMGAAGCGKSECRETLVVARKQRGDEYVTKVVDLNPKAVSSEELYGYMMLGTREWKDGLLSKIMRDLASASSSDNRSKWIVLDGDLDANWIESMNSVMDDNKTLTLASNERIPLKANMRMIFEIRDLKHATPATVSRAGILFISNDDGFQWRSLIASWVGTKGENLQQRATLSEMVDKYVQPIMHFLRQSTTKSTTIVPMEEVSMVQTFLFLLDAILDTEILNDPKKTEAICGFISVWAFGCALTIADDGTDYRKIFSEWWRSEFKNVKFPARDSVFDYWLNPKTLGFDSWRASPFFHTVNYDGTSPLSSITLPTPETASVTSWMSLMVRESRPFMLCGQAGTGKTQLVQGMLKTIDPSTRTSALINFNYYTNSAALQSILESKLAKRVGNTYGPAVGSGDLIFFLDDLNLPQVDPYNTQSAIALLRQHVDYGHWYDRTKLTLKQIVNCQYISCMNPTAGSFFINPRLQRHFVTFAITQMSMTSLQLIYQTFLDGYVQDFVEDIRKLAPHILRAALGLHAQVCLTFRKTASNFHYEFNIRHLSNVFQGILMAKPSVFEDPFKFALLWLHESARVYGDRLVNGQDLAKYNQLAQQQAKKCFPSFNFTRFYLSEDSDPILFCHFANGARTNEYDQVIATASLHAVVDESLVEYNELYARMDLVLFKDALEHVARIVRIISNPSGHALLVGVGGSGRKSLSRLSAFICGYAITELAITAAYNLVDFKNDLQAMFLKAGVKGESVTFLLTDSQIKNERMLVLINDLLSSGNILDLYTSEEQANLVQQILPKVKASLGAANGGGTGSGGVITNEKETCWKWLINEIKKNLHCVLCFSPASEEFRTRARRFPALVNCTVIDWFQPWPKDALHSVAVRFLQDLPLPQDILVTIQHFFPFSFESACETASQFLANERRRVYLTPKSYLELLKLFGQLLQQKQQRHVQAMTRLQSGIDKMDATKSVVANMEVELATNLDAAEKKKGVVEEMASRLRQDKSVVEAETEKANVEAAKCAVIQAEVKTKKADTEHDLAQAQPILDAAMAALDTLSRKDLGSCKTMSKPPSGVGDIFGAVVVLLAGVNANVVIQKNGKVKDKDRSWEACKKALLGNVNVFVDELKDFRTLVDQLQVPDVNFKEVRPFLQLEHFNVEAIEKKNSAAAGLCAWVINIVAYYDAIVSVEPKRKALAEANEKLRVATEKMEVVQAKARALQEKLAQLTLEFDQTNEEVQNAVKSVEKCRLRMSLAKRLTDALGSESVRWSRELGILEESAEMIVGDVLIASSFVSYIGPFTKPFRDYLINDRWIPWLRQGGLTKPIAVSDPCNPLAILTTPSQIAEWNTRGLPSDRVSIENGAIVRCSNRWPLMIDPQLQGIYWLREMENARTLATTSTTSGRSRGTLTTTPAAAAAANTRFHVVRQDQHNLGSILEQAIESGASVLVENMGEKVDNALWPVISRCTTTRGHKVLLKLGDKNLEFHADFRLYLHTKLSNPHYPPELQAETTVINFSVTQQGLEDQLLSLVIRKEWPKKARMRTLLIHQQNEFKIKVQSLEDRILTQLADAEGDVTENVQLITDLEQTKATAVEIAVKAAKARATEAEINDLSGKYQQVAARGALLFFIMDALRRMHSYYVYSLNAFVVIFQRGIDLVTNDKQPTPRSAGAGGAGGGLLNRLKAAAKKIINTQRFQWDTDLLLADRIVDGNVSLEELLQQTEEDDKEQPALSDSQIAVRCAQLKTSITEVVFNYIRRGVFEKDKLILATQLCFSILNLEHVISSHELQHLITNPSCVADPTVGMGLLSEWMKESIWLRVRKLEELGPTGSTIHTTSGPSGSATNSHAMGAFSRVCVEMRADCEEWKEWYESETPEIKPLPGHFKTKCSPFQLLLLVRVLRPDRMVFAIQNFIEQFLGKAFTTQLPFDMEATYQESSASTPLLFVLFPGVDPTSWVEALGKKFDYNYERGNLINISMGQGQEAMADQTLLKFSKEGSWVILQNIHLMQSWLPKLERTLEVCSASADTNFRCFLSAEPPALASLINLPESLLQSCIKVANQAPTDVKSNLRRAWAQFSLKEIEDAAKPNEFQGCLFALCFFHSLVLGRRRFGYQGWSRQYSFNTGDLLICADVLKRYINNSMQVATSSSNLSNSSSSSIPWEDLRYIFGEIMYGGHITDLWDRITNNCYLEHVFKPEVLTGLLLTDHFKCPDPFAFSYSKYATYIETDLPNESANVYGLHPNAEIGYLSDTCNELFLTIAKFQTIAGAGGAIAEANGTNEPGTNNGGGGGGGSVASAHTGRDTVRVLSIVEALLERLPGEIDLTVLQARATPLLTSPHAPFVVVALQEASRMHTLMKEIHQSLTELTKAINGTLNMTETMEDLVQALSINQVPGRNVLHVCSWEKHAWWSRKSLGLWYNDFLDRINFLLSWTSEFELPFSMWISGLFNPTAFLTAIKQCTARKHNLPLDSMTIETHFTTILQPGNVNSYPSMGACVHGLFLEGARWEPPLKDGDKNSPFSYEMDGFACGGHLADPKPKELFADTPVIYARAVSIETTWEPTSVGYFRRNVSIFDCPVYQTTQRGPTYVFLATLNTVDPRAKWTLAGLALIMQKDT